MLCTAWAEPQNLNSWCRSNNPPIKPMGSFETFTCSGFLEIQAANTEKTEVRYSFASTNIYRSWANHETDSLQYVCCTYCIRYEDFFGLDSISLEKNQLKKTECQHVEKGFLCSWTKAESCVTLGGAYLLHIK